MASKNIAEVVIAGRVLKITGYESTEYLHQVATYINDKIGEFEQLEGYRRQSSDQKQIMIYMNLADDFFKARRQADQQKIELEKKEKEMYSLKHDLVESQMAHENLEQSSKEERERLEQEAKDKLESVKKGYKEKLEQQEQAIRDQLAQEYQEKLAAAEQEFCTQAEKTEQEFRAQAEKTEQEFRAQAEKAEQEIRESLAQEYQEKLAAAEENKGASYREAEGLRAQIRELRHEIMKMEAEAKNRGSKGYGNRYNGN
ncbi:MAG: hypothetical protein HFI33_08475 [Lachnospiraceae bacterium]|nr:hypothetical protein [Lachnospiraceae bacterium]